MKDDQRQSDAHGGLSEALYRINCAQEALQNHFSTDEVFTRDLEPEPVSEYPVRENSKRQIKDAGKLLRQEGLPLSEDVVAAFRVAHNWRLSHAYPMLQERKTLSRLAPVTAVTAGRIKRMDSIRKKLRRSPLSLPDIQDFAGVRAIVDSSGEVDSLLEWYQLQKRADRVKRIDNYIKFPKLGGYRSVHIIRSYQGTGKPWFGQKVEIQIRTRLQHVWATAVEAVGSMRDEDLKAGEGSASWLRLLALMSGHIAAIERQPLGADIPTNKAERREELASLNHELSAVETLSAYRTVVKQSGGSSARFFLVRLDTKTGQVTVHPHRGILQGGEEYFSQRDQGERAQSVLVSVDGADGLRHAYPNYFLDVGEFVHHLKDALGWLSYIDRMDTGFLRNLR